MLLIRAKKVLALVVISVVVLQMATMSSEAHARWRDNSDQLPSDDGSAGSAGAIVALGVVVVVGVIYAIVKWNKKKESLAEVSPVTNENRADLATFRDLKNDASTNQNDLKNDVLVTGLSINF